MTTDERWVSEVCAELTRTRIMQFAGVTGEFSQLHVDEPFARSLGRPAVMGHGMFSTALAARAIIERFGSGSLRSLEVRYTAPVYPGDALTASCCVIDRRADRLVVEVRLTTGAGLLVLTGTGIVRRKGPGSASE